MAAFINLTAFLELVDEFEKAVIKRNEVKSGADKNTRRNAFDEYIKARNALKDQIRDLY